VERAKDLIQEIRVQESGQFAIALDGNPTTGYSWQVRIPEEYLSLVEHEFRPGQAGLGRGGQELFHFQARQAGVADLLFTYRRSWEAAARRRRTYRVVIEVSGDSAPDSLPESA